MRRGISLRSTSESWAWPARVISRAYASERASASLRAHGFTEEVATRVLTNHLPYVKGSDDDLETFHTLRR